MLNKVSTGNSMLDVLLCVALPLALRWLAPLAAAAWERVARRAPPRAGHERFVSYTQRSAASAYHAMADIDKEPPNHLLHAAILLYLNAHYDMSARLEAAEVQLRRVKRSAAAAAAAAREGGGGGEGGGGDGGGPAWAREGSGGGGGSASKRAAAAVVDDDDDAGGGGGGARTAGGGGGGDNASDAEADEQAWTDWHRPSGDELLDHLGVSLLPPNDVFVEVEPGLRVKRCVRAQV